MKVCIVLTLMLALSLAPAAPGLAQTSEEIGDLKKEIEVLKEGQKAMQGMGGRGKGRCHRETHADAQGEQHPEPHHQRVQSDQERRDGQGDGQARAWPDPLSQA